MFMVYLKFDLYSFLDLPYKTYIRYLLVRLSGSAVLVDSSGLLCLLPLNEVSRARAQVLAPSAVALT